MIMVSSSSSSSYSWEESYHQTNAETAETFNEHDQDSMEIEENASSSSSSSTGSSTTATKVNSNTSTTTKTMTTRQSSSDTEADDDHETSCQQKRNDVMTKAGRQMSIQMVVGGNKTEDDDDDDDDERKNNPTNKSNDCFQRCFHFTLPSKEGARDHAQQQHGKHSWRVRALHFIHRPTVQRTLMLLLLLDVLILFAELFLLALYPQCHLVERDCIACCPNEQNNNDDTDERWLATVESSPRTSSSPESQHQSDSCDIGYIDTLGEPSCDDHKWEAVHQAEDTFFGMTVAILSLFLVENIVELMALTPAVFFRHVWYLSDFVIVFTSLTLELVFHWTTQHHTQATLGGSLVFFRLWRFLRISRTVSSKSRPSGRINSTTTSLSMHVKWKIGCCNNNNDDDDIPKLLRCLILTNE
ncbi:ion transport protein [Nitzschia inconspicua]|uniref:Ion transport protein n=1 Tax=Nitzschia inconspicua TaxID=303405 RepID=A0A9K3KG06_9STRA|nr:ion transport protein [Nitzschia inconspicua]